MKTTSKDAVDRQTSRKYKCSLRTARRWRSEGAPVGDPDALRVWLSTQKNLPVHTRQLLDRHARPAKARKPGSAAGESEGAPAALRRLEAAELSAWKRFEAASQAGDAFAVKSARQNWLGVSAELRRFDESVGRERRQSDVLPRDEAMIAIANTVWSLNLHLRTSLAEICTAVRKADNIGQAIDAAKMVCDRLMITSTALASSGVFFPGLRDHPWVVKALEAGLEDRWLEMTSELLQAHRDLLVTVFEQLAKREADLALAEVESRAAKDRRGYLGDKDVHAAVLAACPDVPAK